MAIVVTPTFGKALDAEGFPLPKECREVQLTVGIDGLPVFRFECLARSEDLVKFGRALERRFRDQKE